MKLTSADNYNDLFIYVSIVYCVFCINIWCVVS